MARSKKVRTRTINDCIDDSSSGGDDSIVIEEDQDIADFALDDGAADFDLLAAPTRQFDELEDDKNETSWTRHDRFQRSAKTILLDFVERSESFEGSLEGLLELDAHWDDALLLVALSLAKDSGQLSTNEDRERLLSLLVRFYQTRGSSLDQSLALEKMMSRADDLQLDFPFFPKMLASWLHRFKEEKLISSALLRRLPQKFLLDTGSDEVAVSKLRARKACYKKVIHDCGSLIGTAGTSSDSIRTFLVERLKEGGGASQDQDEAVCGDYPLEMVKAAVLFFLESCQCKEEDDSPAKAAACASFLQQLRGIGVLGDTGMLFGLLRTIGSVDEIAVDNPKADHFLIELLKILIEQDSLEPDLLKRCRILHVPGGGQAQDILKEVEAAMPEHFVPFYLDFEQDVSREIDNFFASSSSCHYNTLSGTGCYTTSISPTASSSTTTSLQDRKERFGKFVAMIGPGREKARGLVAQIVRACCAAEDPEAFRKSLIMRSSSVDVGSESITTGDQGAAAVNSAEVDILGGAQQDCRPIKGESGSIGRGEPGAPDVDAGASKQHMLNQDCFSSMISISTCTSEPASSFTSSTTRSTTSFSSSSPTSSSTCVSATTLSPSSSGITPSTSSTGVVLNAENAGAGGGDQPSYPQMLSHTVSSEVPSNMNRCGADHGAELQLQGTTIPSKVVPGAVTSCDKMSSTTTPTPSGGVVTSFENTTSSASAFDNPSDILTLGRLEAGCALLTYLVQQIEEVPALALADGFGRAIVTLTTQEEKETATEMLLRCESLFPEGQVLDTSTGAGF
ncbi:unnamed protein product [Amoebophrya sp. A25]|nr:unnamed protein product [Amoebophrya sp. A25]|eukprot:GSA25T00015198001.1